MKFVALISGGKDSIYSILECIRRGHELVACVHLGRPESVQEESYMYQTAASEVVRILVEECLGVPLVLHQRTGTSVNTSLVYDGTSSDNQPIVNHDQDSTNAPKPHDEVEDLHIALQTAQQKFPSIQAVSSGAILSTYQRVRIENVCSRLGLTSLSYLWRRLPQKELLQCMIQDRIEAVLVRTACPPGLIPRKHLNQTLRFLWDSGLLERLHQRYQFHVCGEGGEYESLVLDSPIHQKKLVLDSVEIVESEDNDGVGDLRILQCHAEIKTEDDVPIVWSPTTGMHALASEESSSTIPTTTTTASSENRPSSPPSATERSLPNLFHLPLVQQSTGGLFHVGEIMAPVAPANHHDTTTEAELAVQEALQVFTILQKTLEQHACDAKDVLFVHLYLSEISHFANINSHYQQFFGTVLPPSRSCVAVGKHVLPGGRRVLLDCLVQPGSGQYMRTTTTTPSSFNDSTAINPYAHAAHITKTSKLREVLHVQSISHWAPVCVGPYSQVNTLRSGLHFLAGQIGLVPATMELQPTWTGQLEQCWTNVAAVLDALEGGSLQDVLAGLIYVSNTVSNTTMSSIHDIESMTRLMIQENAKLVPGRIDATSDTTELYGGYEDAETWEEAKAQQQESVPETAKDRYCPIIVVSIPEMPKGALIEVEIMAGTRNATKHLDFTTATYSRACAPPPSPILSEGWDTGHAFALPPSNCHQDMHIHAWINALGHQNAAVALVTASVAKDVASVDLQTTALFDEMLLSLSNVLAEGRSGFDATNAIHLRLFHASTDLSAGLESPIQIKEDGLQVRTAFQGAIAKWAKSPSLPASTVVPVHAIDIINVPINATEGRQIIYALQALLIDPVHLETDIWIRKDREYNI